MRDLPFRAVILDMDGLVLDTEAGYFSAWRRAACDMGFDLPEALCLSLSGCHGRQIRQSLLDYFGGAFDLELFLRVSGDIWRAQVAEQGIAVKPGFFSLMQCLNELALPFALATNSRRQDAEQCLAHAGLDGVFECMLTRDDVERPKPAPDLFLAAAGRLGLNSRDCLVLEDSPIGVAAAAAAECPCILVPSVLPADQGAAGMARQVYDDLQQAADFISAALRHPI